MGGRGLGAVGAKGGKDPRTEKKLNIGVKGRREDGRVLRREKGARLEGQGGEGEKNALLERNLQ